MATARIPSYRRSATARRISRAITDTLVELTNFVESKEFYSEIEGVIREQFISYAESKPGDYPQATMLRISIHSGSLGNQLLDSTAIVMQDHITLPYAQYNSVIPIDTDMLSAHTVAQLTKSANAEGKIQVVNKILDQIAMHTTTMNQAILIWPMYEQLFNIIHASNQIHVENNKAKYPNLSKDITIEELATADALATNAILQGNLK